MDIPLLPDPDEAPKGVPPKREEHPRTFRKSHIDYAAGDGPAFTARLDSLTADYGEQVKRRRAQLETDPKLVELWHDFTKWVVDRAKWREAYFIEITNQLVNFESKSYYKKVLMLKIQYSKGTYRVVNVQKVVSMILSLIIREKEIIQPKFIHYNHFIKNDKYIKDLPMVYLWDEDNNKEAFSIGVNSEYVDRLLTLYFAGYPSELDKIRDQIVNLITILSKTTLEVVSKKVEKYPSEIFPSWFPPSPPGCWWPPSDWAPITPS